MNSILPNDLSTKPTIAVFCNLIGMALQNKMPWEMLANTLDCIIPSFEESRQVIKILLKELENLQEKVDFFKNSEHKDGSLSETELIEVLEVAKQRIDEEMYSSDASESDMIMN